ncbi:MAG: hypothetical protein PWQ12_325 [Clostridiales bacterium]|nr:hypothetical protein [Clostridiales bacterium]
MTKIFRKIKHHSIRTRMLLLLLSIIAVVFLIVFWGFNLFLEDYIEASVYAPLESALALASAGDPSPRDLPPNETGTVPGETQETGVPPAADTTVPDTTMPDTAPDALRDLRLIPMGAWNKTEVLVLSETYDMLYPDERLKEILNTDAPEQLTEQLKQEAISLEGESIREITAGERDYYFVSVKLAKLAALGNRNLPEEMQDAYLVYYVDMTAIRNFSDRVNLFLLAVLGIASALAVGMSVVYSVKMARPIKELAQFAGRIGRGDFTKLTEHYNQIELAELAERMNQAADQLDAYDEEQKTFFQNVSHEFRTPLQVIRSNAEGIKYEILEPKEAGDTIIRETYRLTEMVEDLLYLSRVDQVTSAAGFETYDLREILSTVAERQGAVAKERGIRYVFEFSEEPVYCLCDEHRMARAFSNVLSNALRYARSEVVFFCDTNETGCVIEIRDDGVGISETDMPNIFKRFYKGAGGNHGIGLAIVKSIIDQHNGLIEVHSDNSGTMFRFQFQKNI